MEGPYVMPSLDQISLCFEPRYYEMTTFGGIRGGDTKYKRLDKRHFLYGMHSIWNIEARGFTWWWEVYTLISIVPCYFNSKNTETD